MAVRRLSSLVIALSPVLLLALSLAALARPAAAADDVVTICNDATFSTVLNSVQASGGGTITFSCSDTIIFLSTKIITSNVTIDGGGNVTLSGGNTVRLFIVQAPGRATLRNLTLSGGSANENGGAIVNHGRLSIQDSILRENNTISTFSGGAIYNLGTLTATHASFINNIGGAAGAVYAYSDLSRTTIRDSVFRNNRTTHIGSGWGGAIYLSGGAPAVISETQFISNTARDGGGAVLSFGSPVVIINSQFISNAVTLGSGGGLYHTGAVTISGGLFQANKADDQGGGVYAGAHLVISGTQFMSNTSQSHGGGALAQGGATLNGGLFQGNQCMQTGCEGGGLIALNTLALTGTQFISNSSQFHGGGAYASSAATLHGGFFQSNQCMQANCVGGGLVSVGALALTSTQFISNTSQLHGGGASASSAATLHGGLFQGNRCMQVVCLGGGLRAFATLALTGTSFVSNTAQAQGGGALALGAATLNGGLFYNNQCMQAGCQGGGLSAHSSLAVNQAGFVANRASAGGGLAHTSGGNAQVANSLFAGNTASSGEGSAIRLASPSSVTLYHNTIASATVAAGSAVHVVSSSVTALNNLIANSITGYERVGGSVTENYTLFATVSIHRAGGIAVGADSFGGAAGFVYAAGGDFRLGPNSQAIDEGIDIGVTLDFFGAQRPLGAGFDIGYHEYDPVRRLFLPLIKR